MSACDIGLYGQKFTLRRILLRVPGVRRLNPNWISLAALIPGAGAAYCLLHGYWLATIACIAARMVLSTLDGLVAEEFGKSTPLGAFLNRLPGEFNDVLIAAALWPYVPPVWLVALVALTGWVQMFCVLGVVGGAKTQMAGPCGQTDRLVALCIGCAAAAAGHNIWHVLVVLVCAGCVATIGVRIARSVRELTAVRAGGRNCETT